MNDNLKKLAASIDAF